jgi:hypothetical protein
MNFNDLKYKHAQSLCECILKLANSWYQQYQPFFRVLLNTVILEKLTVATLSTIFPVME